MAKLTLNDLTQLQSNETSAVNTINNNNAATEAALEKTLSRDGTSPNGMQANLDMDGNKILNLPNAVSDAEPVTLSQLTAASAGIVNVKQGGVLKVAVAKDLNFTAGATVTDAGAGQANIAFGASANQSYFYAKHTGTTDDQTNVTGDGTQYTPKFTNVVYNVGGDYNSSTTTYTAPVNGIYAFNVSVVLHDTGFTAAAEQCIVRLVHSRYGDLVQDSWADTDTSRVISNQGSWVVHMAQGDTASLTNQCTGSAKTVDDVNATSQQFSGALIREI